VRQWRRECQRVRVAPLVPFVGNTMRTITCGRSRQFVTLVSDADYDFLTQWLWTFAVSHRGGELIYIRRSIRVDGRNVTVLMHRVVMERKGIAPPSLRHTVHHVDHDSLNNQRDNLEWLTHAEQMAANRLRHLKIAGRVLSGAEADIPFD
jgi:hypothetical protein